MKYSYYVAFVMENAVKERYRDLVLLILGFLLISSLTLNEQPSLVCAKLTTEKG